jgi:hypothetical protein
MQGQSIIMDTAGVQKFQGNFHKNLETRFRPAFDANAGQHLFDIGDYTIVSLEELLQKAGVPIIFQGNDAARHQVMLKSLNNGSFQFADLVSDKYEIANLTSGLRYLETMLGLWHGDNWRVRYTQFDGQHSLKAEYVVTTPYHFGGGLYYPSITVSYDATTRSPLTVTYGFLVPRCTNGMTALSKKGQFFRKSTHSKSTDKSVNQWFADVLQSVGIGTFAQNASIIPSLMAGVEFESYRKMRDMLDIMPQLLASHKVTLKGWGAGGETLVSAARIELETLAGENADKNLLTLYNCLNYQASQVNGGTGAEYNVRSPKAFTQSYDAYATFDRQLQSALLTTYYGKDTVKVLSNMDLNADFEFNLEQLNLN